MNIFYTSAYGNNGIIDSRQKRISEAAKSLGFREIPIYYNIEETAELEKCDLDVQMDGSFSSFTNGSVLILQYPCGGGLRYDKAIVEHARYYSGALVLIYNHNSNSEADELNPQEKELFENADLVVDAYRLKGFDEQLFAKKELIDAVLAVTYQE